MWKSESTQVLKERLRTLIAGLNDTKELTPAMVPETEKAIDQIQQELELRAKMIEKQKANPAAPVASRLQYVPTKIDEHTEERIENLKAPNSLRDGSRQQLDNWGRIAASVDIKIPSVIIHWGDDRGDEEVTEAEARDKFGYRLRDLVNLKLVTADRLSEIHRYKTYHRAVGYLRALGKLRPGRLSLEALEIYPKAHLRGSYQVIFNLLLKEIETQSV